MLNLLPSAGRQKISLSVVLPMLGGESLFGTTEQLNRGTIVPSGILVCIPKEDAFRVESSWFQMLG